MAKKIIITKVNRLQDSKRIKRNITLDKVKNKSRIQTWITDVV